jgi:hypothetical protein
MELEELTPHLVGVGYIGFEFFRMVRGVTGGTSPGRGAA